MNIVDKLSLTAGNVPVTVPLPKGKSKKKINEATRIIYETFADDGESYIPAKTIDILISVLPLIADEDFKKVTIQLDGGIKASVKLNSNGKIEVERKDTLKVKSETQS